MPPKDLRDWIALLEREGELVRVTAEVDPDLEITEIVDRTVKAGGPALLFENPKGAKHPLLINQFGTERRMCLAFGVESLDELGERVGGILEMQPPDRLDGQGARPAEAEVDRRLPRANGAQRPGAGDRADGRRHRPRPSPHPALLAGRSRAVHHAARSDHARPPQRRRNVGMYRMQVVDRNTTFMHWQIHKDGRADWLATDGRIPVAVALGLDPITAYSASAPLPKHIDELMLAGFFRGEPVELVKGVTVDIEVPANAEIVLEGYIEHDELGPRGRSATTPATTRRPSRSRSST
jgi:3-polyprenyl-4-hydroxybenzoate decarboxylase and related decarboxylases